MTNQIQCSICGKEVDKHYTPSGEMYWDKGHNPFPVKTGENDRCCDTCEAVVVFPARMRMSDARRNACTK